VHCNANFYNDFLNAEIRLKITITDSVADVNLLQLYLQPLNAQAFENVYKNFILSKSRN
jgi:hypothetical protein